MQTEFRVIFTSTHATAAERDKVADWLKRKATTLSTAAAVKRADVTKDEYLIPDASTVTEKIL